MQQYTNSNRVMEFGNHFKNGVSSKRQIGRGIIFCVVISIFFASCSTAKIYTKPDAAAYAMKHKTLAILPPEVKIEGKNNRNVENKKEQEKVETINAQNEMYSRLLTFVQKGNIYLEIQDIEKTNALLLKMGNSDMAYEKMTPEELAQALGVDAILQSNYIFSQHRDIALGIVYAIVFFPYGIPLGIIMAVRPINSADLNMRLYDGATGYLLYSYNKKFSERNVRYISLVDKATKKVLKKSPYYRK